MSKHIMLKLKGLRKKFPKLIADGKIIISTRESEDSRWGSTNFMLPAEIVIYLKTSCEFDDGKIGRDKVTSWLRRNDYTYSKFYDSYLY